MRSYLEEVDFEGMKQRFEAFWQREIIDRPLIAISSPQKEQKKKIFPIPDSLEERWINIKYILNTDEEIDLRIKRKTYREKICYLRAGER